VSRSGKPCGHELPEKLAGVAVSLFRDETRSTRSLARQYALRQQTVREFRNALAAAGAFAPNPHRASRGGGSEAT
jgi:hypothetical protein